MPTHDSIAILRALGDPSRLAIVRALLAGPRCVEELAGLLDIAVSTASFHLRKLEGAEIAHRTRDQYYALYSINSAILRMTLDDLIAAGPGGERGSGDFREYRLKTLSTFFRNGRLVKLPAQKKKRRIVLEHIAARFTEGRDYSEGEVNALIAPVYDDYCAVRREMIDDGLMSRRGGAYRRTGPLHDILPEQKTIRGKKKETEMTTRSELKRRYRENPPEAGIYRITNTANGKVFIGKSLNVRGKLNGQMFELKLGSHRNRALQRDWNEFGDGSFAFDVVDILKPDDDPLRDMSEDLAALEEAWLEKLQPYGDRGYNRAVSSVKKSG